jgi:GxxExxY protein
VGTYVPDLVVNDIIIIEIKCKPYLTKEDHKQFWHYLKSTKYRLGFLINFGNLNGVEIERRIYDTARGKTFRIGSA